VVEPLPQFWPDTPQKQEVFVSELKAAAAQTPLASGIETFLFHRSFPVDARHNAKIFRDQLAHWADKILSGRQAA
jgi:hypothetical protein